MQEPYSPHKPMKAKQDKDGRLSGGEYVTMEAEQKNQMWGCNGWTHLNRKGREVIMREIEQRSMIIDDNIET